MGKGSMRKRVMEIGKKRWAAMGLTLAMVMGLAGCGGANYDNASPAFAPAEAPAMVTAGAAYDKGGMEYGYADMEVAEEADMSMASQMNGGSFSGNLPTVDNSAYFNNRKLIRNVSMDVETQEFEWMVSAIETQVKTMGGYIEQMNTYNGSNFSGTRSSKSSSITARIPKQHVDSFLDAVSEAGNVIRRSENMEDVTLAYVDLESRKKSLQTEQERLLSFLERAETLEDIITLESRLSDVRYQLESMESQLRTYDNKVDFSTVYMNVQEVKELTPPPEEDQSAWERLAEGFVDSLTDVKDGLVDFFIWFVVHIPYLLVWAVVIIVIVLIIKAIIRRGRKKKEKKRAAAQQQTQTGVQQQTQTGAQQQTQPEEKSQGNS